MGKEKKVTVKDDDDNDVELETRDDDDEVEEPKLTKVSAGATKRPTVHALRSATPKRRKNR